MEIDEYKKLRLLRQKVRILHTRACMSTSSRKRVLVSTKELNEIYKLIPDLPDLDKVDLLNLPDLSDAMTEDNMLNQLFEEYKTKIVLNKVPLNEDWKCTSCKLKFKYRPFLCIVRCNDCLTDGIVLQDIVQNKPITKRMRDHYNDIRSKLERERSE